MASVAVHVRIGRGKVTMCGTSVSTTGLFLRKRLFFSQVIIDKNLTRMRIFIKKYCIFINNHVVHLQITRFEKILCKTFFCRVLQPVVFSRIVSKKKVEVGVV